jgi:hypothetical protein
MVVSIQRFGAFREEGSGMTVHDSPVLRSRISARKTTLSEADCPELTPLDFFDSSRTSGAPNRNHNACFVAARQAEHQEQSPPLLHNKVIMQSNWKDRILSAMRACNRPCLCVPHPKQNALQSLISTTYSSPLFLNILSEIQLYLNQAPTRYKHIY